METLTQMMYRYTSVAKSIRTKLMLDIDAIPENPNIKRLDICCFTVRYTEVLKSRMLCAEYYDFAQQKRILKGILQTKETLESQLKRLMDIADTGKTVIRSYGQSYTFVFHPDVVKVLKEKLDGFELEVENSTT